MKRCFRIIHVTNSKTSNGSVVIYNRSWNKYITKNSWSNTFIDIYKLFKLFRYIKTSQVNQYRSLRTYGWRTITRCIDVFTCILIECNHALEKHRRKTEVNLTGSYTTFWQIISFHSHLSAFPFISWDKERQNRKWNCSPNPMHQSLS